jgi:hypothetical protein
MDSRVYRDFSANSKRENAFRVCRAEGTERLGTTIALTNALNSAVTVELQWQSTPQLQILMHQTGSSFRSFSYNAALA